MSERKDYITILSVISAIAVVILHTNVCFWTVSNERYWLTANIMECVLYFAVPIFLMITGANLIDYKEKYSTRVYIKKRLQKAVIPFIIWTIIGFIYLALIKCVDLKSINFKLVFNSLFSMSPLIPYYWFFIPLFSIYLSIPLLAAIEKGGKKRTLLYLAFGWLIIYCIIPFIINSFHLDINFNLGFMVCSSWLIYPIIGYLISKTAIRLRYRIIIYAAGLIGLVIMIFGTYFASLSNGVVVDTFKGYLGLPCFLYSMSVFTGVKYISKYIKNMKFINFMSKYTFAIYLLHFFIIKPIEVYSKINFRSIFYRLGAPFIIIPICIFITWLLRKIPIVKKIIP